MLLANSKDISVKPFDIKKARKELRKEVERAIEREGTTVFKSVVGTGKSTAGSHSKELQEVRLGCRHPRVGQGV